MSNPKPKLRRFRRVYAGALLAVLTLLGVLWLVRDTEQVERARANAIAQFVGAISDGVGRSVVGLGVEVQPDWLGIRRYDAPSDSWVLLADGDSPGADAVLLIHGLDEPGGIWDELAPALHADGHSVLRFDYHNDQSIIRSADALTSSMEQLQRGGVRRLDLVCHSMGGLVARDALSRDGFDELGIRIGTMVTLGTPHKGSPWARLRSVAEMREQVQRWAESDDLDPARLLGFFNDGDGQAGIDLMPGSAFFDQLEERSLPAGIHVVCVVGRTDTPSTVAGTLSSASARGLLRDLVGEEQASLVLTQVDKLGGDLGDGVVPVSSAVMDGATDIVVVYANHRGMIRTIELEERVRSGVGMPLAAEPPAIQVVLDRLRKE
ncbi:MAG: esterase/lipase family protein [Phycisphaerales bacterium]